MASRIFLCQQYTCHLNWRFYRKHPAYLRIIPKLARPCHLAWRIFKRSRNFGHGFLVWKYRYFGRDNNGQFQVAILMAGAFACSYFYCLLCIVLIVLGKDFGNGRFKPSSEYNKIRPANSGIQKRRKNTRGYFGQVYHPSYHHGRNSSWTACCCFRCPWDNNRRNLSSAWNYDYLPILSEYRSSACFGHASCNEKNDGITKLYRL